MKKSVVLAIAFGVLSFSSMSAIAAVTHQPSVVVVAEEGRTEIQYEDLPEAIRTNFEGSDYAAWEVQKVEEVTKDDAPEEKTYELTISDGTQSGIIAFDEEGNMVE